MVYGYALEPEVVLEWSKPELFRNVWDKFGIGTLPGVHLKLPDGWEGTRWYTWGGARSHTVGLETA